MENCQYGGKLGILNIENIKFVDEYQSQSR